MEAKEFANKYYQTEKSKIDVISIESAIIFAEKYHADQLKKLNFNKPLAVSKTEINRNSYDVQDFFKKVRN